MRVLFGALLLCILTAQSHGADWSKVRSRIIQFPDYGHHTRTSSRIIGGTQSERHQFPYQVGSIADGEYLCGASLITSTVVLTAAHCTYKYEWFEINLAAQNIMDEGEVDRLIVVSNNKLVYPEWDPAKAINDISLIILDNAVSGIGISTVRLPTRAQESLTFEGEVARVSGWGRISDENSLPSPELNWVDLTVIKNSICASNYGNVVITSSKLCTETKGGTTSICNGDSGGPLVLYEEDGEPTQIGIVSFGSSDGCEASSPVAFTRITSYLDWLEENTGVNLTHQHTI